MAIGDRHEHGLGIGEPVGHVEQLRPIGGEAQGITCNRLDSNQQRITRLCTLDKDWPSDRIALPATGGHCAQVGGLSRLGGTGLTATGIFGFDDDRRARLDM